MKPENYVKQSLHLHRIPVLEHDLPHILNVLGTIYHEQANLLAFPDLNEEVPMVIVDQGLIKHD